MNDDIERRLADGQSRHRAGDLAAAEACYRAILAVDPDHTDALSSLGVLLRGLGRLDDAIATLRQAAGLAPDNAAIHNNLGNALIAAGVPAEAIAAYRRALDLAPDYAEAHANLGRALAANDDSAGAIACLEQAYKFEPRLPGVTADLARLLNDLGNSLFTADDLAGAGGCYQRAVALDPTLLAAVHNLGNTARARGDVAAALDAYDQALRIDDAHIEVRWNRSLTLLLAGREAEGWADYGLRWQRAHDLPLPALPTGRRWSGEAMPGATLEILDEQGLGDAIQFARYIPAARRQARAGHVRLRCQASLVPLLGGIDGVDEVVPREAPAQAFDAFAPILDLPPILGTETARGDGCTPYLAASRVSLPATQRPRVGLVWAGGDLHAHQRSRSLSLEALARAFDLADVELYALQVGPARAEIAAAGFAGRITDLGKDFTDFADTARAVAAMDLVVGVDTAVVHLAGALARPVWTLLAFVPDWRWGMIGNETPWYPTMRLFRQTSRGDWQGGLAALADVLTGETRLN